jgi:hypothetical protein
MSRWLTSQMAGTLTGLFILIACASGPEGTLASRLLPVEKRNDFVQANGVDARPEIRNAFVNGEVVRGMAREWVLQLYGRPDRITDRSWVYQDRKGNRILEIFFERDTVDSVISILQAPPNDHSE